MPCHHAAHEPAAEPGHERNRKILARWRAKERKAKFPLLERMASLIVRRAGDREPEHHEWPDEIPEDLFLILEPSFEVVSMVMHDDGLAASA